MATATRTYWLTSACRIARKDQSLVIERADGTAVHVPVTDVRDIVACAPADINSAVISLLNTYRINVHFLSYYGDYPGSLLTSDTSTSGETVMAQARLADDAAASLEIARNAFISYANGITYARVLTAIRLTPLHSGIAFLHSTMERQRHSLVLDLAEVFKPMFAERLLLRLTGRGQLKPHHFDADTRQAMLSDAGRKLVVQAIRDELAVTVQHRGLGRKVAYDELLYLEALQLTRACLEKAPYKPFRIWW